MTDQGLGDRRRGWRKGWMRGWMEEKDKEREENEEKGTIFPTPLYFI